MSARAMFSTICLRRISAAPTSLRTMHSIDAKRFKLRSRNRTMRAPAPLAGDNDYRPFLPARTVMGWMRLFATGPTGELLELVRL